MVEALQEYFQADQKRIKLKKELDAMNKFGVSKETFEGKYNAYASTLRRLEQLRNQVNAF